MMGLNNYSQMEREVHVGMQVVNVDMWVSLDAHVCKCVTLYMWKGTHGYKLQEGKIEG